MKNQISSDYLFHFTHSLDIIKSILKNGFRVCENQESLECLFNELSGFNFSDFGFSNEAKRIEDYKYQLKPTLKMVCFCDLPLNQTAEHSKDYGDYALAFTKDWAARNDINPVFYINTFQGRQPLVAQYLSLLHVQYLQNRVCNLNRHLEVLFNNIKPYEGTNPKTKEFKRFYDEREWRFIPGDLNTEINEVDGREYLRFDLSDLAYIIVQSEDEKKELQKFLLVELPNKNNNLKVKLKDEL